MNRERARDFAAFDFTRDPQAQLAARLFDHFARAASDAGQEALARCFREQKLMFREEWIERQVRDG